MDIDNNSCLLPHNMTAHASRHNAEKRMLRHRSMAHNGLKALEILPKVVADALKINEKCDCESCINCKLARKPFNPTTSHATEPLQHAHLDICGPMEKAIGGGRYILPFINNATRHLDEHISKYASEALETFTDWKAIRENESGKQVKRFHTDGGGEYTSKRFTEYLKLEGIL